MASFPGLIMTTAGRQLQAKAQIGRPLQFTRAALGDGYAPANIEAATALVSQKTSLSIQDMEVVGDGTSRLRVIMTNQGLVEGFFVREVGVFARDPDTLAEVLYSYANSGDLSDYMPAAGGATIVEQVFDLYTVIGNAQNVTAVINDYITIATKADVEEIRPYILPTGGEVGQLLRKKTNAEGDVEWFDPSSGLDVRVHSITEERTAIDGQDVFSLAIARATGLAVYVEGVRLAPSEWEALSASQVKLKTPLAEGMQAQFVNNEEVGTDRLARVSLSGPTLVYPGSTNTYTITDYDDFSIYTVGSTVGTATRSGATVTLVIAAGEVAPSNILTVGRNDGQNSFAIAIGAQSVAAPQITSPANNATNVNETPTIEITAFATFPAGIDTHASTIWQIATDAAFTNVVHQSLNDTANLRSYTVPAGVLQDGASDYYVRAAQNGATVGAGPYGAAVKFTTKDEFFTFDDSSAGLPYGGGFYAGNVQQDDGVYALIVAPKSAQTTLAFGPGRQPNAGVTSDRDGYANSLKMASDTATFAAAEYCRAYSGGGHADWYLPAKNEVEILYRKLKPTTDANNTSYGYNPDSAPPGSNYTSGMPAQTANAAFKTGAAEAFDSAYYWSSTVHAPSPSDARGQFFNNGGQVNYGQPAGCSVRPVRRLKISN